MEAAFSIWIFEPENTNWIFEPSNEYAVIWHSPINYTLQVIYLKIVKDWWAGLKQFDTFTDEVYIHVPTLKENKIDFVYM